jgi:hypothetical protein
MPKLRDEPEKNKPNPRGTERKRKIEGPLREDEEELKELCRKASTEQDPEKLLQLTEKIIELLDNNNKKMPLTNLKSSKAERRVILHSLPPN